MAHTNDSNTGFQGQLSQLPHFAPIQVTLPSTNWTPSRLTHHHCTALEPGCTAWAPPESWIPLVKISQSDYSVPTNR